MQKKMISKYLLFPLLFIAAIFGRATLMAQSACGTDGETVIGAEFGNSAYAIGDLTIVAGGADPNNINDADWYLAGTANVDVYAAITIPAGAVVRLKTGAVLSVYGDFINNGYLFIETGATINFYGQRWLNATTATVGDGSVSPNTVPGGAINFIAPRPVIPSGVNATPCIMSNYSGGDTVQQLKGGNIPMDIALHILNAKNIQLITDSTKIEGSINWDIALGDIILGGYDLIFTVNGAETGYQPDRFAVTNGAGHVVKESYTGNWIYPVGIAEGDYTPASVNNAVENTMHVSVQSYPSSASTETDTSKGMDRTWNIYANNPTGNSCINLQHNLSTDGSQFDNTSHYVTRYGTSPNNTGDQTSSTAWQVNTPGAGTTSGSLSTGGAVSNASERGRCYTTFGASATANESYFTKSGVRILCLLTRAYLEGSLMSNGGATAPDGRPLMRDNLRVSPFTNANYIPVKDPYQFATDYVNLTGKFSMMTPGTQTQFQQVTDSATVFGVTGQNAIVDWAYIELRNKTNNTQVLATRGGLLQRDGDIVDVDGVSCLSFPGTAIDSYYVAVRHRSHLGVMTLSPQSPAQLASLTDFTAPSTALFDFGTTKPGFDYTGLATNDYIISGYRSLWQGDVDANGKIKFDNPNGDDNVLYFDLINFPDNIDGLTTYNAAYGYWQGDYDMTSKLKYDNPAGDHNLLYFQVINYPINYDGLTTYDHFIQQIP